MAVKVGIQVLKVNKQVLMVLKVGMVVSIAREGGEKRISEELGMSIMVVMKAMVMVVTAAMEVNMEDMADMEVSMSSEEDMVLRADMEEDLLRAAMAMEEKAGGKGRVRRSRKMKFIIT
jgi:hypothetical protein